MAATLMVLFGCSGKPHLRVLAAAYQNTSDARGYLGRAIVDEHGQMPLNYVVFRVNESQAQDLPVSSNFERNEEVDRQLAVTVAARVSDQCRGWINSSIGQNDISNTRIVYDRQMNPAEDQLTYTRTAQCCDDNGETRSECSDYWVITAIYKTRVELDARANHGVTVGGGVVCGQPAGAVNADAGTSDAGSIDRDASLATDAQDEGAGQEAGVAGTPTQSTSADAGTGVEVAVQLRATSSDRLHIDSTGWNVVWVQPMRSLCQQRARGLPRAMNSTERRRLQAAVARFGQGMLEVYQCRWMEAGVNIMNSYLQHQSQPSDVRSAIVQLYGSTINQLIQDPIIRQSTCSGLAQSLVAAGAPAGAGVDCDTVSPWLAQHSGYRLSELNSRQAVPDQVSLIRDIIRRIPAQQRADTVNQLTSEWSTSANAPNAFAGVDEVFGEVVRSCENAPGGCDLEFLQDGLADSDRVSLRLTTKTSSAAFRTVVFTRWLDHFARTSQVNFVPGCGNAAMRLDTNGVRYSPGRCRAGEWTRCFNFDSPVGTETAASDFASTILPT